MVMLGVIACLLLALGGVTGISSAADNVLYARPDATGSEDCSDWANACTLQDALASATADEEIWVAEGTHKPGALRTDTFQLTSGVALYGGFAGSESLRDERDWTVHEAILSGDIGTPDDDSDNTYHVVTGSGTNATAVLDGFTITGGNANSSSANSSGGGMYNSIGSPLLLNVTISGNSSDSYGGGMLNASSSPTLVNVTFSRNSSDSYGYGGGMCNYDNSNPMLLNVTFSGNSADWAGGMYNRDSNPTLTNVTFSGNSAGSSGGMLNHRSSPTLVNVTFSGNSAHYGGGMHNLSSNPTLTNVTFSGNYAEYGGGMYNYESSPALTNCILWGNTAPTGPQICNAISSTPTITYSDIQGGYSGTGNINADPLFLRNPDSGDGDWTTPGDNDYGDLRLQPASPAIDVGDNSALPADTLDLDKDGNISEPLPIDLDGNFRIVNGVVDMGAYEARLHVYLPLVLNNYAP
jgi:hypothetical protein